MCLTLGVAFWLTVISGGEITKFDVVGPYGTLQECIEDGRMYEAEGFVTSTCYDPNEGDCI